MLKLSNKQTNNKQTGQKHYVPAIATRDIKLTLKLDLQNVPNEQMKMQAVLSDQIFLWMQEKSSDLMHYTLVNFFIFDCGDFRKPEVIDI